MYRHRLLIALLTLLSTLVLGGVVLAQVSPTFDLHWSLLGSGGGTRQSTNARLQDSLGQWAGGTASSANYRVESGFLYGVAAATSAPTSTPTPTATVGPPGDAYEDDSTCTLAKAISTDGESQTHTFHIPGDQDWIKFYATANKSYVIQTSNPGVNSDPVLLLFDSCGGGSLGGDDNAFGQTVRLEWDVTANRWYYVKLQQFDPAISGTTTNYNISVTQDTTSPATPRNPRCASLNQTTLGVQWQQNSERDVVRYIVNWHDQLLTEGGAPDVNGRSTTYTELLGLTPGKLYYMTIQAQDFSGNTSSASSEVFCMAIAPPDTTAPTVTLQQPTTGAAHTTPSGTLAFSGLAQDPGNNLSRVKVTNKANGFLVWDYSLSGSSDTFHVEGITLVQGANNIEIVAYDGAGNTGIKNVTVTRTGPSPGAVIIVGGHNETFSLQPMIDNMANRAYRIFKQAGFEEDRIYYLAYSSQDADEDGQSDDVDAPATAANLDSAIRTWAAAYVGPDKPLHIYLSDHGFVEGFCANGCSTDQATPDAVNDALNYLEANKGVSQVNIIVEACHSGSFIDRLAGVGSISKANRVVISSTGRNNNAYASATGGYFTDAFFSCIASSGSLKACYDQAKTAVALTGLNQTPWLDDNGDGSSTDADGLIAASRHIASSLGASPQISSATVLISGVNGTLEANVQEGGALIDVVWAAIYAPSFQEPDHTTLNPGVPSLRLDHVDGTAGLYRASYPNGFTEQGDYRVIVYVQDKAGMQAQRKAVPDQVKVYLPLVTRH